MASGTEIFRLFGSIFIDSEQAEKSLGKTEDKAKNLQDSFAGAVTKATSFAGALKNVAAVAAATAVFKLADSVAAAGDEIDKQSQKLGISAQAYQEWEAILGHSGTSMDSLKAGMKTLTKAIADGSEDQVAAFQAIGLSMDDIKNMSTEDVFSAVITGLQNMEESADRTNIATALLGRSAQELGPLLNTSAEATEEMRQTVNDLGGVMSNEAVAASAEFKDALQDLETVAGWFKRELVAEILPAVTTGMQGLTSTMVAAKNGVISLKNDFVSFGNSVVTALDKASFALNKFLGKQAVAGFGSYNDYAAEKTHQSNVDARRRAALAGQGISNKSWSQRQAEAAAAAVTAASAEPSTTLSAPKASGSSGSGKSSAATANAAVQKVAQVIDSLTTKSQEVVNGITTDIQTVVEKYDDGTQHITKTVTESGTEIVDEVEKNYKSVTKYVDDVKQKVEKTVEDTDKSISALQASIDKNLSEAKSQWKNGIFGEIQTVFSNLKNRNWTGIATDIARFIWGEVSPEQRQIISKWAADALTTINESYSGGGAKAAYERIREIFTNGIAEGVTEAGTAIQSFNSLLDGMSASGGAAAKIASVATSVSSMSTSVIGSLGGIVAFISANPVLAAVLGVTALAGGVGIAALSKGKKSKDGYTSDYESLFSKTPIYDSLKEFGYRSEQLRGVSMPSRETQSSTGLKQLSVLERISDSLDEHLPAIGTGQVVFDTGAVAGELIPAMTGGIDQQIGISTLRKARGN